ncbi:MAG: HEAT repeat domain-containing protein [Planctomycetota bacterium]|nr:HEAT repeat domain-containing protein [Planctomycetota bacterium]
MSQTACYAKDRANAIENLGNRFDCVCNPEILTAMVYALNDADERVRKEAADELGDQLRKNPCCCCREVVAALTCALGDCDRGVVRQAVEGLRACGYDVIDGCCNPCDECCNNGCAPAGTPAAAPKAAPAPTEAPPAVEAPAKETYFPSRLRGTRQTMRQSAPRRNSLAGLFSLLD